VETKCELVIAEVFRTVCLCSHEKGKLRYLVPTLGDLLINTTSTPQGRAPLQMEPTVQPNGHVCATWGAVTGAPNAEPKLSRARLKLGLASTSLAVSHFWCHASIPTDALQRISMTAKSSCTCLQATGHAFHWLPWSERGTRGWPNDSERLQTGL